MVKYVNKFLYADNQVQNGISINEKNGEKSKGKKEDSETEETGQVNLRVNSKKKDRWADFADKRYRGL